MTGNIYARWGLGLAIAVSTLAFASNAGAISSLKIQPLSYETQLQKGERKTGFIDISNPSGQSVKVTTSVEAFRQVDDDGRLEFFESEAAEKGITPDLKSFTLGPREAQRMVFELDGTKLPEGDVFAALFFATKPDEGGAVAQAVRVGTLFIIENGTPGSRKAEITNLQTNFLQIGSVIEGEYAVKNTAKKGQVTGFTPLVDIKLSPFGSTQQRDSSLVFAGRERSNNFSYQTNLPGLYRLSATYDDSIQSRWVLVLPVWLLWAGGALVFIGMALFVARRRRQSRVNFAKSHNNSRQ